MGSRGPYGISGAPRVQAAPRLPAHGSPLRSARLRQRQAEVRRLYAGLQQLWEERRGRLQEQQRLWQLRRELDDVEQWVPYSISGSLWDQRAPHGISGSL